MENIAAQKTSRRRMRVHLDMTPMVDLAFLLLTFFVLTTTLNQGYIMKIQMPDVDEKNAPPIEAKHVLTLLLDKEHKVYWYVGLPDHDLTKVSFSSNGLRNLLLGKKDQIHHLYVLIKPTDHSTYDDIVNVMDELTITEIPQYTLADLTPEDNRLLNNSAD